jgi:UDP-galactopyranose mutase
MLGPVVKIDPATLPVLPNVHYLGAKTYAELPQYIGGWDVAVLPFARNEATRFISPTKTPEYMAAGRPVVSTSIRDVVRPYGQRGLVRIADHPADFVTACAEAMAEDPVARLERADAFLRTMSWDATWARVDRLMAAAVSGATAATVDERVVMPLGPAPLGATAG